jgi:Mce-associated membrane protein
VAGLRKPADESATELPAKPRPRPVPRPAAELDTSPAEDTQVFAAVETEPEVDALTGEEPPRPAPRRKVRDTGIAKPTEEAEVPVSASAGSAVPRTYVVAIALVLVALILGGLAYWFHSKEEEISSATSNTALLDVAKTTQVKDAVSKAAEALFSYDFNNIKKTEDAANNLLANDDVRNKYNSLMGEVKRLAPAQKMIVTCKVTRAAVIMLNGDLAKVMVFVDQTSTRTDTKKTTAGTAQLHLNAQLQGDKWKITDMDTYNAPKVPAASQAPASPSPSPSPSK